jgi:hypothetical protein
MFNEAPLCIWRLKLCPPVTLFRRWPQPANMTFLSPSRMALPFHRTVSSVLLLFASGVLRPCIRVEKLAMTMGGLTEVCPRIGSVMPYEPAHPAGSARQNSTCCFFGFRVRSHGCRIPSTNRLRSSTEAYPLFPVVLTSAHKQCRCCFWGTKTPVLSARVSDACANFLGFGVSDMRGVQGLSAVGYLSTR